MERLTAGERRLLDIWNTGTVLPDREVDSGTGSAQGRWIVTVYDNEYNTVQEVMATLISATGCTVEEARIETWEIHHLGKSVVHCASEDECLEVQRKIAKIGIRVEATED